MLEIHPLADEAQRQQYIDRNGLPEHTAVLRATENDEVTGNVSVTADVALTAEGVAENAVLTIHTFEYADDFTGELLLRAAVSYAFNRAIPKVRADVSLKNALFDKVGFQVEDQYMTIHTKNVVHFCKK